ncbi:MAG: acyltransferase [Woeseiaceae bacterium]|nr:acyltransferase [Woeseiaceae bacterium]
MSLWTQAKALAEQTPEQRNRYVDFLRSVSILVVITGHWMIATAWYVDGDLVQEQLLKTHTWTQWLTWVFQVMPIFFFVGGYSNAVSLESARNKGVGYAGWLAARLNRLVGPLLILLIFWAVLAVIMQFAGVSGGVIQYSSQASLIPIWFLAIYIMVVILAPLTYRLWQRYGFASFWIFVAAAIAVDTAFFAFDLQWLGWSNYFWVWLAVHHLGFAWRDGRAGTPGRLLLIAAGGLIALSLLIFVGPYPLAMVGSPDEGLSNTLPPKITLLALAVFQYGLLLAVESPMRRTLDNLTLWTATVLINSMIMSVYLWHITVMVVLVSLLYLADGFGLGLEPGTPGWFLSRIPWIAVLYLFLLPVALLVSPLERRARAADAPTPSAYRQVGGAMLLCLGVALLARYGYGGGPLPGLDLAAFALVVTGSGLSGLLPGFK